MSKLILAKKLSNGVYQRLGTVVFYDTPVTHLYIDKRLLKGNLIPCPPTILPINKLCKKLN